MNIIKIQGGLGNQLFQLLYAIEISGSHKNLDQIYFDTSFYENNNKRVFYLSSILNVQLKIIANHRNNLNLGYFDSFLYKLKKKISCLLQNKVDHVTTKKNDDIIYHDGYWQYYNYHSEDYKLLKLLLCEDYFLSLIKKKRLNKTLNDIIRNESVSIHIRRTDYLNKENKKIYNNVSINYYIQAIYLLKVIKKNIKFFIFSDVPIYCKEIFSKYLFFRDCEIINTNDTCIDFYLMSKCKNHIYCNSTFSLLASILSKQSKEKIIIGPKKWFVKKKNISHPYDPILI